ncbi:MAG: acyl-CoA dehydrogenase family protein [Acidimicrobiia bacterium]
MEFTFSDEQHALREEAIALALSWRERVEYPEDLWLSGHDPEFAQELGRRGWIGMTWPVEEGGGGRSAIERFLVFEALISYGGPVAAMWMADRQMGPTLLQFGTPEQRKQFLPGIISGKTMWCIGMSEPDAGSDVASLSTKAVRDGDDWIVNGSKIWTSGAMFSDYCYLIARTDPDAPKHAGLSEFVVDMRLPGIEVRPIVDMTANEHFCEIHFQDVRVPAANMVGTLNGSFRQVMRQMEHERGGIDRIVSNFALYHDLMDSGLVDTGDPVNRQEIARIESAYKIGRLMVLREVMKQAPQGWSSITKTFGTEFEVRLASFCARVLGPSATLWGPGTLAGRAARSVCYAPGYTIMGGTTQILRNIMGERVLGLPR